MANTAGRAAETVLAAVIALAFVLVLIDQAADAATNPNVTAAQATILGLLGLVAVGGIAFAVMKGFGIFGSK